jgi:very-short-patch-repair endonuclease
MDHGIEESIADQARRQHGVVTRAQLLRLGLLPGAIRRRARSGRLRRLHRGVYLVGPVVQPQTREMAAVLACGQAAVLSHGSAAALWGLTPPQDGGMPVDISIASGHDNRRRGIRVRRVSRLDADERTELTGIRITTPIRTLLDFAAATGGREVERALALAERGHLVTRKDLLDKVERYRGRPGVPLLRAALEASGGPALTRSEAESRFLALIRQARLPAPEVNVRVGNYEIDFLWRAEGIAVEVDGYRYHSSLPRFESDRRRAAHLAARGIQIIPLTWRQVVDDGVATAVQLGQALTHARFR